MTASEYNIMYLYNIEVIFLDAVILKGDLLSSMYPIMKGILLLLVTYIYMQH